MAFFISHCNLGSPGREQCVAHGTYSVNICQVNGLLLIEGNQQMVSLCSIDALKSVKYLF